MNNSASAIAKEIDRLATLACTKLPVKEAYNYLRTLPKNKRHYYKGPYKGILKDVYDINGDYFEKLWNKMLPYASQAAYRSHYFKYTTSLEDLIADVRLAMYERLQHQGPKPSGTLFSKIWPATLNNVLTNARRKATLLPEYTEVEIADPVEGSEAWALKQYDEFTVRQQKSKVKRRKRTRVSVHHSSIDNTVASVSEDLTFHDILPGSMNIDGFDAEAEANFLEGATSEVEAVVTDILAGYKLNEVVERNNIKSVGACKKLLLSTVLLGSSRARKYKKRV